MILGAARFRFSLGKDTRMKTWAGVMSFLSGVMVGWAADGAPGHAAGPSTNEPLEAELDLSESMVPSLPDATFEISGLQLAPAEDNASTAAAELDGDLLSAEPGFLDRLRDEEPSSLPGGVIDESRRPSGRVLEGALWGKLSVLGSTLGGGVAADEVVGSVHDWKELPGLHAVPDHELAAGLSIALGRDSQLGLAYRTIQAAARWDTDHYWGASAVPVRVEDDQNHGVVLVFLTRF